MAYCFEDDPEYNKSLKICKEHKFEQVFRKIGNTRTSDETE